MDTIDLLFGAHGTELNTLQMMNRAILVFFISLALIRLSGRRSFGMRLPLDNIIVILLGAILGRAVVGASPFIPTIAAATAVVVLHRLMAYIQVKMPAVSRRVQGRKILLFNEGAFLRKNMVRALISEEDIHEAMRQNALEEDLNTIDKVYLERNGKLSIVKKDSRT